MHRKYLLCTTFVPHFFLKGRNLLFITASMPLWQFCVCLYMNECVCTVCVSALGAWCIDILYLPNVSAFALVQRACVTICCLFVSVLEIPEIPTIHHSSHQAGSISSLVSSAKAEWFPLIPHPADRQSFGTCAGLTFYLIVSSFPLSCWNLLWRFLICSDETGKKKKANTNNVKVCKCYHNYSAPINRPLALDIQHAINW